MIHTPPASSLAFRLQPSQTKPAFALIIAISLMAFILLLLLSLSAVVQVESRSSEQAVLQQQAREHARLGMIMALGELQKQAGHDQRITGPSGTMGYYQSPLPANWSGPTDVSGFDVVPEKSHYVGVWNTAGEMQGNWLVSDNPAITRIDLHDLSSAADIDVNAQGELLNRDELALLVGPGSIDVTVDGPTRRDLAASGGAGDGKPDDVVVVEKVPLTVDDGAVQEIGSYAYWVGDEGVKAKLNVADRSAEAATAHSLSADTLRQLTAQRSGLAALNGTLDASVDFTGFPDGDPSLMSRLGTLGMLETHDSQYREERRRLFHDLSLHSHGVLSDTKHGSLKRDLSFALDSTNSAAAQPQTLLGQLGASESALLFDPLDASQSSVSASNDNLGGPKWAQLKDWYQLGTSGSQLEMRPQTDDQHGITPILAAVRMWFYAGLTREANPLIPGQFEYRLRYFFFPTVVLANPYGHDLRIDDNLFFRWEYANPPALQAEVSAPWGHPGGLTRVNVPIPLYDRRNNPNNVSTAAHAWDGVQAYVFTVQPSTIPAGSALVYTAPFGNRPMQFVDKDGRFLNPDGSTSSLPGLTVPVNRLEPGFRAPGSGFYFDCPDVALSTTQHYDNSSPTKPEIKLWRVTETADLNYVLATARDFNSDSIIAVSHRHQNYGLWTEEFEWSAWESNVWPKVIYAGQIIEPGADADDLDSLPGAIMPAYAYMSSLRMTDSSMVSPISIDENVDLPMRWLSQYNPRAHYANRTPDEWDVADQRWSWTDHKGVNHSFPSGPATPNRDSYYTNPNWISKYFNEANVNTDAQMQLLGDHMPWGFSDQVGSGQEQVFLFEVPDGTPVTSVGQLMHVNFSRNEGFLFLERTDDPGTPLDDGVWWYESESLPGAYHYNNTQPAYAVGNSWASPYIPARNTFLNWANKYEDPAQSGTERAGHLYDYSWHLNESLWDRYFFSTVPQSGAANFPLPNGRLKAYNGEDGAAPTTAQLRSFDQAAANLLVDGAFNIHSASPAAWKALLASLLGADSADPTVTPYKRVLAGTGGAFDAGSGASDDEEAYLGYRALSDAELTTLAQKLANHITARVGIDGAFSSLSDFVNRNPDSLAPEHRQRGVLQSAIDWQGSSSNNLPIQVNAGGAMTDSVVTTNLDSLNEPFQSAAETIALSDFTALSDQVALELENIYNEPIAQGAPGYLTQADLLARLGPLLRVRSDTFRVRAYGDVKNPVTAEVEAQAWCEVIVQRLPEYVVSNGYAPEHPIDSTEANALGYPNQHPDNEAFGRRFRIVSFRWLNKEDV